MRYFYCIFCLFFGLSTVNAQSYVGIWQGYVTSDATDYSASYTLDVKNQTANMIFGKAYLNVGKYPLTEGVLDFIGVIDRNKCRITELSILKSVVAIRNHFICIKYLDLTLNTKNKANYLTGRWSGSTAENEECYPGEVYLTKITDLSSDQIPGTIRQEIAKNTPLAMPFLNTTLTKPIVLDVSNRLVTMEINDYLKEDNDTVSVYYNRRLIVNRQRIGKKAYTKRLFVDADAGINEIIIYANNLGDIPPNTSTLVVRDNSSTQKVRIESSMQTSVVIYLRYVPPRRLGEPRYSNYPPYGL